MTDLILNNIVYIPSKSETTIDYNIYRITGKLIDPYPELKKIIDSEFILSDYGNEKGRCIETNIRNSVISKKTIELILELDDKLDDMKINPNYEYIKYEIGGYFVRHMDRKREPKHTHSILLYPPQEIEGGELALYINGVNYYIIPKKNKWKCIIFPIEIFHESKPVIKGIKEVIKGYMILK